MPDTLPEVIHKERDEHNRSAKRQNRLREISDLPVHGPSSKPDILKERVDEIEHLLHISGLIILKERLQKCP
jgi:hypothetical protein